ncbi:hypothetical protein [Vreelandella sulfidaeris]
MPEPLSYLDVLTDIGAIVSAVAGMAGFALGFVGYKKSTALQKRLFDKPYFVAKWPEMSKTIERQKRYIYNDLSQIEHEFIAAEEGFKTQNPDEKGYVIGVPFPDVISKFDYRDLIDINEYSWDYTPELQRAIANCHRYLRDVSKAASSYNQLLEPARSTFRGVTLAGEYSFIPRTNPGGDFVVSTIDINSLETEKKQEFRRAAKVAKKYRLQGDDPMMHVVTYPRFQRDALRLKRRILNTIKNSRTSWVKVEKLKERFDTLHRPNDAA